MQRNVGLLLKTLYVTQHIAPLSKSQIQHEAFMFIKSIEIRWKFICSVPKNNFLSIKMAKNY